MGEWRGDKANINKDGRPPKGQALTEILRAKIDKDEIAEMLIAKVREGDLGAIKYVYDRIDGKPTEKHEVEGTGLPVIFNGITEST